MYKVRYTYARQVIVTPKGFGHDAAYTDLVQFDDMRFALVNPLLPMTHSDYLREELTESDALTQLMVWPDEPAKRRDGSLFQQTIEGRAWLKQVMAL